MELDILSTLLQGQQEDAHDYLLAVLRLMEREQMEGRSFADAMIEDKTTVSQWGSHPRF